MSPVELQIYLFTEIYEFELLYKCKIAGVNLQVICSEVFIGSKI